MKRPSQDELKHLKPFVSIFLIVSSLFVIVFAKMEERRIGYQVLKITREQRLAVESKRERVVRLAKLTRPQHIEKLVQDKLTLKKVQRSQIVHISGGAVMDSGIPRKEM